MQEMNRRNFVTNSALALAATMISFPTTGCTSAQAIADINTVLTEAINILVVADPGASWVTDLQNAVKALKAAEQGWTAGGAVVLVIDALNTIAAVTSVIPLTAVYSPLIDVLVAGIDIVLNLLVPTAPAPVLLKTTYNPHSGRAKIEHRAFRSGANDFKAAWNGVVAGNPALIGAKL